jgi:hypothetical protein
MRLNLRVLQKTEVKEVKEAEEICWDPDPPDDELTEEQEREYQENNRRLQEIFTIGMNRREGTRFLKCLFQKCDQGMLEIRRLKGGQRPQVKFIPLGEIINLDDDIFLSDLNIYFGVATRDGRGGGKENVLEFPAVWVDYDGPHEEFTKKLNGILKPSAIVHSGRGIHAYWLLEKPASKEEIETIEKICKGLASYLGGDMGATDGARILRVPGTVNQKVDRTVRVKWIDELFYTLENFAKYLPPEGTFERKGSKGPPGWQNEILDGVKKGERNLSLARLAGRYLQKKLGENEILPILLEANSHFQPPLEAKEVEGILASVAKTHQRGQQSLEDRRILVSELPTLGEIYDLEIKVEWVVKNLIPKQANILVHGPGGIGKTWLALQIGSCISEGLPFLGLETDRVPCFYIDFENPWPVLHARALVLGKSDLRVWHSSHEIPPPKLDADNWINYKLLPPGVLIFDTLRAAQSGDENSSRDMSIIMGRLKELRDMGFTIILLHHTPKSNERIYKGSTAIIDLCDHALSLERVKEVGSEKTIEDIESWDYPLRLGVRQKTRFEPFNIYMQFNPEKGFEKAIDPDDEKSEMIRQILIEKKKDEGKLPNQTELGQIVKERLSMNSGYFRRIMRRGIGIFWDLNSQTSTHGGKRVFYEPVFSQG